MYNERLKLGDLEMDNPSTGMKCDCELWAMPLNPHNPVAGMEWAEIVIDPNRIENGTMEQAESLAEFVMDSDIFHSMAERDYQKEIGNILSSLYG